jgi:hypothetical protein
VRARVLLICASSESETQNWQHFKSSMKWALAIASAALKRAKIEMQPLARRPPARLAFGAVAREILMQKAIPTTVRDGAHPVRRSALMNHLRRIRSKQSNGIASRHDFFRPSGLFLFEDLIVSVSSLL